MKTTVTLTVADTHRFRGARRPFLLNISDGPNKEWLVCTRIEDAHTMRVRQATRRWRILVWLVHIPGHVKWAYRDARDWVVDLFPDEQDATTWMVQ